MRLFCQNIGVSLGLLIGVASVVSFNGLAFAGNDPVNEAPRPGTAGAWGMFIAPAADLLGEFGPATSFGSVEFENVGESIYFQKALSERLSNNARPTIDYLTLDVPTDPEGQRLHGALESIMGHYTKSALGQTELMTLAGELQAKALELGRKLAIGFDMVDTADGGFGVVIHVAPLVVKTVAIENGRYFKARSIQHRLAVKKASRWI